MRNPLVSLAAGFAACIILLLAVGYVVITGGVINPGADEPIPEWERWMAKSSLRAYLKREAPNTVNPLEANEANLKHGIDVYRSNCQVCHGDAKGTRTNVSKGLYKKPNLFFDEDWSQDKDGLVYWFIDHGVRLTGMPAYHDTLKEKDIWSLVLLIKHVKTLPPPADAYWTATGSGYQSE